MRAEVQTLAKKDSSKGVENFRKNGDQICEVTESMCFFRDFEEEIAISRTQNLRNRISLLIFLRASDFKRVDFTKENLRTKTDSACGVGVAVYFMFRGTEILDCATSKKDGGVSRVKVCRARVVFGIGGYYLSILGTFADFIVCGRTKVTD